MEEQDLMAPESDDDAFAAPSRFTPTRPPRLQGPSAAPPGGPPEDLARPAPVGPAFGAYAATLSLRSRLPQKAPSADVRRDYTLTTEIGLVLALLALIGLFHLNIQFSQDFENLVVEQEVVQMEEIKQTKQEVAPPPPPRPQAPVAVADDVVLEDVDLNLDAALDIEEPLAELPPPPPPPEEKKKVVEEPEPEIFVVVEQMPELIGGIESIQARIRYPEMARMAGISGRVFVQFIVDEKGNVVDPEVIRGIGGGCDEEAVRAVREAKFKPGKQRGKPVKVRYVLPIVFKLRG